MKSLIALLCNTVFEFAFILKFSGWGIDGQRASVQTCVLGDECPTQEWICVSYYFLNVGKRRGVITVNCNANMFIGSLEPFFDGQFYSCRTVSRQCVCWLSCQDMRNIPI